MKLVELHTLIASLMQGNKAPVGLMVTSENGLRDVTGIDFCVECSEFHIKLEKRDASRS